MWHVRTKPGAHLLFAIHVSEILLKLIFELVATRQVGLELAEFVVASFEARDHVAERRRIFEHRVDRCQRFVYLGIQVADVEREAGDVAERAQDCGAGLRSYSALSESW